MIIVLRAKRTAHTHRRGAIEGQPGGGSADLPHGGCCAMRWIGFAGLLAVLGGCAGPNAGTDLPRGATAYDRFPSAAQNATPQNYRIGPLDTIDISVYQEADLSTKGVQVDASGNIAVPLVGTVAAAGRTASELGQELNRLYGKDYLEHPQVTVVVVTSASQKVVVQGEVTEPGVYDIKGPTTLLEAISLAKGETRVAALKDVVVFRTVNGQRMGAVFDVNSIRRGEAQDPQLRGSDLVVVGYSNSRGLWRDALSAAPLLNIFRPF
jgi:polysaccharide export outer membrane protein